MSERTTDWEKIEAEYRAGQASVRQIARLYGVTESAIRDRAKRYGWERGVPAQSAQSAQPELRTCAPAQTGRVDDGLTEKQRQFVREYLIDLNATAAAKRAGYSEESAHSIGHENLRKPEIAAAIQRAMDDRATRTEITADRVLREYARVAFGDPRSVMEWGPDGVKLKASADLTDDEAALVSEVSQTTTKDGGSIKLKTNSKLQALEALGKHLGMFVDRTEITGDAGEPLVTVYMPANGRDG